MGPEDLLVDAQGQPRRLDHAYSWSYPLAVHGMLHTVIRNAWAGDPQTIDVLFLFMANMSWNSAMNTGETMRWLTDKDADGEYRIPKIIYSDAYSSEMVAYADLVLAGHDLPGALRRRVDAGPADLRCRWRGRCDPASGVAAERAHARARRARLPERAARSRRAPEIAGAAGTPTARAKYRDYSDYIVNHERAPGIGLLAGWRGADGSQQGKGAPNPQQLQQYIANGGFWRAEIPKSARYFKMANRDYLNWSAGWASSPNARS